MLINRWWFLSLMPTLMIAASVQAMTPASTSPIDALHKMGLVEVWVNLKTPPLSKQVRALKNATGAKPDAEKLKLLSAQLRDEQDALMAQLLPLGARELTRISLTRNAVAVRVQADRIREIEQLSTVLSVQRITHRNVPAAQSKE